MKKTANILSTVALSAALICTLPITGNASAIDISETSISLENISKDWREIPDKHTFHTFTNGTDKVTVLKYSDYRELPALAKTDDQYEAIYQTFYCAGDTIYVVTGSAVKAKDISEVKKIIDSISYSENSSNNFQSTSQTTTTSNASSNKNTQDDSSEIPFQGWDSIDLYDADLNSINITRGNDATSWVDDPYDLYSWDGGTNSYIPYQAAAGEGLPIGRGEGWYYYDTNTGSYFPW